MSGRLRAIEKASEALKTKLGGEHHHRLRQRLLPIYSRIPRIHWSQSGEDIILSELLPEPHGTYVDVGAAHPRLGSNTYFLYRRGWSGTLVEPNPKSAAALRKARPRDRVIEAAAGAESGTTWFTVFKSDYLSSIDPLVVAERQQAGESIAHTLRVKVMRLADLGLRAEPSSATLLNVDCEGVDYQVLQGIDWTAFKPRVICVEEPATTLNEATAIRSLLETHGYILRAHTGLSSVYEAQDQLKCYPEINVDRK